MSDSLRVPGVILAAGAVRRMGTNEMLLALDGQALVRRGARRALAAGLLPVSEGLMRIRFLFFALYRDLAGTGELELEVPAGATAATAVEILRGRGGGFARLPEQVVMAVNREYAPLNTPLAEGDEVALLPPVAGG